MAEMKCKQLLKGIADEFERLIDFASSLNKEPLFSKVLAGRDIRAYESGWKLEAYVEATLLPEEGISAVWWLEVSGPGSHWRIDSFTYFDRLDYHKELESKVLDSDDQLIHELQRSVSALIGTYAPGADFRSMIEAVHSGRG
jgi:hypothetical protein